MEATDDFFELDRDIDPRKICRLCLSQSSTMYNVFAKSIVDGYMISLPKIFAYTLDIHVSIFIPFHFVLFSISKPIHTPTNIVRK